MLLDNFLNATLDEKRAEAIRSPLSAFVQLRVHTLCSSGCTRCAAQGAHVVQLRVHTVCSSGCTRCAALLLTLHVRGCLGGRGMCASLRGDRNQQKDCTQSSPLDPLLQKLLLAFDSEEGLRSGPISI